MLLPNAAPVSLSERAKILDILRGFALLGVLMDNVFGFTGYGFFSQAQRAALSTAGADHILGMFELAFINGKFYSIFSLLFGIGFYIMLVRNEQKGLNPYKIFYRRLFILLVIGLLHLMLLWEGDILVLYALLGCFLPLFRKCSDKTLLITVLVLLAAPVLIDLVKVMLHLKTGAFLENRAVEIDKSNGLPLDQSYATYLFKDGAGWKEWRNWQASGYLYRYSYIIESNRIPKVLGMFLLGLLAGRKMIFANLEHYMPLFQKLRFWGFIIGMPAGIALAFFEMDNKQVPDTMGLADTLFYAVGVVPLSLAYVASLCIFQVNTKGSNRWKWLAPVGRMALTNYLMQTTCCIILFYGVGLDWGGNIGPVILCRLLWVFTCCR